MQGRLSRVAWPILVAGVPMCEERVVWRTGLLLATREDLSEAEADAAGRVLGLDGQLRVLQVVEGSPAEVAGFQPGDAVLSFNGEPLKRRELSGREFAETLEAAVAEGRPAEFELRRAGQSLQRTVLPTLQCDYPAMLLDQPVVNAYADGDAIYVTPGMMRFAAADDELGLIVGHELAHNVMGHIQAKRLNAGIGLLFDLLAAAGGINTYGAFSDIGAQAYSQDFEAEADYVGLYLTARSGMDITGAPQFWRKMATLSPEGIERNYGSTHPSHPERFLHLEQIVAEIGHKRARSLSLVPEAKPDNPAPVEQTKARPVMGYDR